MNRLYDFVRRHPGWVDGFWGFVWLISTFALLGVGPPDSPYLGSQAGAVITALALTVALAFRRRAPEKMLLLGAATGLFQLAADVRPIPSDFIFLVLIFTAASRPVRWASRLALGASLTAPGLATIRWQDPGEETLAGTIVSTIFVTVMFLLAWVLGDSLRTRRAYYAELEERAARLERERETQSRIAVAAERARIARELHDVVAHNVSVMVVQADGAAYVLDTHPEQCRTALATISGTGRQALTEMRRLLGVLRGDGTATAGATDYVPQPGVEQLAELVDQVRDTGLPVDFRISGTPRPLPSGVELTAYRIVQEALTNTRKHGGPDASARVCLDYRDDALTVLAEDDGRGAQRELYEARGADGLGQGLIGMRERVGMVGGELLAGPRPGGGFRITATLPMAAKP
ncbi:sensor histidine kinase [Streptomyces harbinensis]|uniref:sensor histidine kinase n=1 Tax=Streptomyces harbinensis TaxID=1176198 RepID=UPI003722615C